MMPIVINQFMKGSAFSSMTAAAIMFFLAIMIVSGFVTMLLLPAIASTFRRVLLPTVEKKTADNH